MRNRLVPPHKCLGCERRLYVVGYCGRCRPALDEPGPTSERLRARALGELAGGKCHRCALEPYRCSRVNERAVLRAHDAPPPVDAGAYTQADELPEGF